MSANTQTNTLLRNQTIVNSAKNCIFGYILIQELISQGALTDESVGEAYTEVRPANCGNENSVLKIVIQGMDIFKMPELD